MNLPITHTQALELLKSMPQTEADMNHYIESEAIMKALAIKLNEDLEYWGMLGLLHDVDWAITKNDVQRHCLKAVVLLGRPDPESAGWQVPCTTQLCLLNFS